MLLLPPVVAKRLHAGRDLIVVVVRLCLHLLLPMTPPVGIKCLHAG